MELTYAAHPEMAAQIRAGIAAAQARNNEMAGKADDADRIADRLNALADEARTLAGSLRVMAVQS